MKLFATILLVLGMSACALADCVTQTPTTPGERLISNSCSYPIQVELRGADGSREMMFLNAFGNESTGTGGSGNTKAFNCPTPKVPSQVPNAYFPVEYSTNVYYCH